MKVTPHSEEELQTMRLMPEGVYPFEVMDCLDMVSKNGNEMIKLILAVYDNDNRKHIINDFLLDAMAFKVRHFCEKVGIIDLYDMGQVAAKDCYAKSGYVKVGVDTGRENPNGGSYPPKNTIKDYCDKPNGVLEDNSTLANRALDNIDKDLQNDIPF